MEPRTLDPQRDATPLAFFLATNRTEVKWLGLMALLYTLAGSSMLAAAYYLSRVVDLLSPAPHGPIRLCLILIVLCLIGYELGFRIGHIIEVFTDSRIRAAVKRALFDHVSGLSFGYFADRFSGQIAHKIAATTDSLEHMTSAITNEFIEDGAGIVISAAALSLISPWYGVVVLGWGCLLCVGILPFGRRMNTRANEYAEYESKTSGIFVDSFTNIAAVKVYGSQMSHHAAYAQIEAEKKAYRRLGVWAVLSYDVMGLSIIVLGTALLFLTASLYTRGLVTVGDIVFVAAAGLRLFNTAWELGKSVIDFIRQRGEAQQNLRDLLAAPAITDGAGSAVARADRVSVEYRDVSFGYGTSSDVLERFSLKVAPGEKLGIVGLSGAGKTTFANLLLRFFDIKSGAILLNGVDVRDISQDYLRSHISYISQDTSLFHATVAENIAYGAADASREQIEQAARLAYADDFIQLLPQGYASVVGERGVKLSGGQRQRIAIARAILADRPLFLLDEATSALDSDSEAKIQKGLEVLMEGKTVIAIAHRLSTLSRMDRIIFLEGGQIIEDGTHDELLARGGKYAALWHMQAGGFLPG